MADKVEDMPRPLIGAHGAVQVTPCLAGQPFQVDQTISDQLGQRPFQSLFFYRGIECGQVARVGDHRKDAQRWGNGQRLRWLGHLQIADQRGAVGEAEIFILAGVKEIFPRQRGQLGIEDAQPHAQKFALAGGDAFALKEERAHIGIKEAVKEFLAKVAHGLFVGGWGFTACPTGTQQRILQGQQPVRQFQLTQCQIKVAAHIARRRVEHRQRIGATVTASNFQVKIEVLNGHMKRRIV